MLVSSLTYSYSWPVVPNSRFDKTLCNSQQVPYIDIIIYNFTLWIPLKF